MTNITEINISTGEVIEREYTQEELDKRAELESNPPQKVIDMRAQDQFLENQESVALRESAIIKLQSLGLTEDEAKAIVGL
jgi:hypothetical protein